MKDYSKYFENPCSFITNILVDEEKEEIYVTFANNIVNKYPCTKENIKFFYQRLEEQYSMSFANSEKVSSNKARSFFIGTALTAAIFLAVTLGLNLPVSSILAYGAIGCIGVSVGGFAFNELAVIGKNRKTLKIYELYLKNRESLEEAAFKDQNILSKVSEEGRENLRKENGLIGKNLLELGETFNVNWMDKASLNDLKTIATQLKIYQGLQQPVEFVEDKPKTKKRIKEQEETK